MRREVGSSPDAISLSGCKESEQREILETSQDDSLLFCCETIMITLSEAYCLNIIVTQLFLSDLPGKLLTWSSFPKVKRSYLLKRSFIFIHCSFFFFCVSAFLIFPAFSASDSLLLHVLHLISRLLLSLFFLFLQFIYFFFSILFGYFCSPSSL